MGDLLLASSRAWDLRSKFLSPDVELPAAQTLSVPLDENLWTD